MKTRWTPLGRPMSAREKEQLRKNLIEGYSAEKTESHKVNSEWESITLESLRRTK
jgi:hypothetical protein